MPGRPVPHPRLHSANDRARQRRVLDECCTTATRQHTFGGAAQVNIHAVKAEGAEHVGYLVKSIRVGAIDLRQNGTLTLDKAQLAPCRRCTATDLLDTHKFGTLHIRLAMPRHNKAKGGIGDPIHGREADNRLRQCMPETHTPGVSSLSAVTHGPRRVFYTNNSSTVMRHPGTAGSASAMSPRR